MKKLIFISVLFLLVTICYTQTGPISSRPAAVALSNTDLFLISQGANSRKLTYLLLLQELYSDLDSVMIELLVLEPTDTAYPELGAIYFDTDVNKFYQSFDGTTWTEMYDINSPLDTLWIDVNNYITKINTKSIKYKSTAAGTDSMILSIDANARIGSVGADDNITFYPLEISFTANSSQYNYNGNYWYNATDTLADREYAREQGGAETDPIYSVSVVSEIDADDTTRYGDIDGEVDTTGLPIAAQVAFFTAADEIGGNRQLEAFKDTTYESVLNINAKGTLNAGLVVNAGDNTAILAQSFNTDNAGIFSGVYGDGEATAFYAYLQPAATGYAYRALDHQTEIFAVSSDSIVHHIPTYFKDSLFLEGYEAVSTYAFLYLDSITHTVKVDSSVPASEALITILPIWKDWFYDRQNGEIKWFNSINKTWEYGMAGDKSPGVTLNKLQGGIEIAYRYIDQLINKNRELENRVKMLEDRLNQMDK